jgi:hypothetical protein
MTERPNRARLTRFLAIERRDRLRGRHRAVDELHRRTGRSTGGRLMHYLRIERGARA